MDRGHRGIVQFLKMDVMLRSKFCLNLLYILYWMFLLLVYDFVGSNYEIEFRKLLFQAFTMQLHSPSVLNS